MTSEILLNGTKISYYEKITDPSQPITLFLHGWMSTKESFHLLFPYLPNILAIDFPGHGHSSPLNTPWQMQDFTDIVEALFQKKLTGKKCSIIAHSFGGRVLSQWLFQHPNRTFESLICIGVPFFRHLTIRQTMQVQVGKMLKSPALSWSRPIVQKIYSWITPSDDDWTSLGQNTILKETFTNIVSHDLTPYFSAFTHHHITLVWGKNDVMAPVSIVEQFQKCVPNAQSCIIPNSGHFPWAENTSEFMKCWKPSVLITS